MVKNNGKCDLKTYKGLALIDGGKELKIFSWTNELRKTIIYIRDLENKM